MEGPQSIREGFGIRCDVVIYVNVCLIIFICYCCKYGVSSPELSLEVR